jgi:hypothetical protein
MKVSNSDLVYYLSIIKLQLLLREVPHLAKYMPEAKDARRMIPDPDNEPDFERISKVFPLPNAQAAALELALAVRNAIVSKMGGSGLQQQLQGATNNNWASSYPSMGGVTGMINSDFNRSVSMPQQRSIAPSMDVATALEGAQAQASNRVKDTVAAAFHLQTEFGNQERQAQATKRVQDAVAAAIHLEAELGIQERQNVAMVMKFAAQRQQQANPGITQSVESMLWKSQQNNFLGYNFR